MSIFAMVAANLPEIERRLDGGESIRAVAADLGIKKTTLQKYRRRLGAPLRVKGTVRGDKHACWRGGKSFDRHHGYVRVLSPGRSSTDYVAEHVLLAEQKIGRRLRRGEVVHHINLSKTDNRDENLHVCATKSEHGRLHQQLQTVGAEMVRRGLVSFDPAEGYRLEI